MPSAPATFAHRFAMRAAPASSLRAKYRGLTSSAFQPHCPNWPNRTLRLNDRSEKIDVLPPEVRSQFGFAGMHPISIAANGINFAVVRQNAKRLAERPGREGVCAVPFVIDAY